MNHLHNQELFTFQFLTSTSVTFLISLKITIQWTMNQWASDRVVAPTPGSVITILDTANEFAIKGNHLTLRHRNESVHLMMFLLSLTGEAKTWLDELNEGTIKTWVKFEPLSLEDSFPPALFDRLFREIQAFSQHENETLTEAWLRMKEMLINCHGHNLSKGNKIFYHGLNKITQGVLNAAAGGIFLYETPNQAYQLLEDKVLLKLNWAKNQKSKPSLKKTVAFTDEGSSNSDTDKSMARMDAMTIKIDAEYKEFQYRLKQPNPNHNDDIPMSREEEAKFIFADKQSGRPFGSLPSNTQPNPKGSSSKPYQPSEAQNEQVNSVFTQSGKSYDPPINPNDKPKDFETPINFDSDDEDDEPTPQPKPQDPKPVKENPTPKPYKLKISYPQRLRKEKMEAQYDHSNYPVGIAENMLIEMGKFTFPVDFVILEIEEDSKVPLIIGRPFLHTADVVIRVKQKQLNLGVEEDFDDLLDEEFDIVIKNKKGAENVDADHLSRIENDKTSDDSEVDDNFLEETLMEITTNDTPWFTNFANYLEDPYLFKVCSDGMIRRCISGPENHTILDQCHHRLTSGHYGPNTIAKKS
ncbi:reverse transcriptase domain-containing protein [Tanacetum coccineum]